MTRASRHLRPAAVFFVAALFLASSAPSVRAEDVRRTPVVRAIQESAPSIVNISTETIVLLRQNPIWGAYGGLLDDLNAPFLTHVTAMRLPSLGSGVIVSEDGLIITNAHVVYRGTKIFVTLPDGETYEAASLGTDLENDLALLKIEPRRTLKPARFAKDVLLGESVIAIGNPFGLQNSVTAGIVSGTDRKFMSPDGKREIRDLIQTDAAIGPGSSGGALVNLEGDLLGINVAVVQEAPNIGFAIPVKKVRAMLEAYRKVAAARRDDGENPLR